MVTLREFIYPSTLEQALTALEGGRESARALAGGTSVIFFRGQGTAALVDITRLGLDEIAEEGDDLVLGACVRLQRLARAPEVRSPGLRALAEAAAVAGPRAVRNVVTLGGNVVGYKRWSDTPNALLALGARVELARAGCPPRVLPLADLYTKHPQTLLAPGELVTRFRLPLPGARVGSAYLKLAHTRVDYALVSAAARVSLGEDGQVVDASLVIGALEHLPAKQGWVEGMLRGNKLDKEVLDGVAERVRETLKPAADMRASAHYLKEVAGVTARDALERAARLARGEEQHG
ncbi:MAG: FAD binding domain-containing protein [Polyangia bacterium]|nr:FAD binding domain-containing protein [Polyangia bacterium]